MDADALYLAYRVIVDIAGDRIYRLSLVVNCIRSHDAIQKLVYAERNMAGVFELENTA